MPSTLRKFGRIFDDVIAASSKDNVPRLSAALAFYTILSLAPFLIITIAVSSFFLGQETTESRLFFNINQFMGDGTASVFKTLLSHWPKPRQGLFPMFFGILTLLIGASAAIAELRNALNTIWGVKPSEYESNLKAILAYAKQRSYSFILVLGIGFLLLLSLIINAVLSLMGSLFSGLLPTPEWVLQTSISVISFLIITVLFAITFKTVPDINITWGDVFIGAFVTSLLFSAGKLLLGLYLGKAGIASAYGAAGSLIAVVIWVYYSAQIFFLGAEFTKIYSRLYGSRGSHQSNQSHSNPGFIEK